MQLGFCIAVAVGLAGSCSSDSTPSLGTSMCPERKKKRKERMDRTTDLTDAKG